MDIRKTCFNVGVLALISLPIGASSHIGLKASIWTPNLPELLPLLANRAILLTSSNYKTCSMTEDQVDERLKDINNNL